MCNGNDCSCDPLNQGFITISYRQSFFEQPIVRPISKGHFELRQILGDYNAKLADEGSDLIELFQKDDLVGKRFYLTTFPLPKRRKKLEKWDATSNTYVQFETEPTKKEKREEDLKPGKNMQVRLIPRLIVHRFYFQTTS